jgi:hypothetical protein
VYQEKVKVMGRLGWRSWCTSGMLSAQVKGDMAVGQVDGDMVQLVHEDLQGRLGVGWTETEI